MTTTARLLTILSLTLPLAACAAQPAAEAPGAQAATAGQDGQAGGAAVAPAPASAPAAQAPLARQQAANDAQAPAQPRSATPTAQPRRAAGAAGASTSARGIGAAGIPATATAAPAQTEPAPATVPAPAANAPAIEPASPAAPETTVGGGAANRTLPAPVTMPASSSTGSLLQTLLALIVVLGVLGALAWFLKRYGPKTGGGNANLRVVGALNLGGRERVLVVEVGNQWIVVGASPGRINALATMPKQEGADMSSAGATLAPHTQPANNFADWLKQTIDKRK